MARNADGLGTRPHKWRGRCRGGLTVGYDALGKPDRRWVYGATQGECQEKLYELRKQHKAGLLPAPHKAHTLASYLDDWLEQKALEVKQRTIKIYRSELAHVTKVLGRLKLASIKSADVQRMMRAINGSKVTYTYYRGADGQQRTRTVTLTARAANEAKSILSNALDDAMTLGLIASNPARPVRSLRHEEADLTVWTAAEIVQFTNTTLAGGCDYHALFYLALTAGLRAGELLALEWTDLTAGRIHVTRTASVNGAVGTPKSRAGDRLIALPSDTLETLELHRRGLEAAARIASPLVFPTTLATMANHRNVRRSLHAWADKAGVPKIRLHDLRHTYASMAISAGMNAVELARQLGHAGASFTLRKYAHLFERAKPRQAPTLAEQSSPRSSVNSSRPVIARLPSAPPHWQSSAKPTPPPEVPCRGTSCPTATPRSAQRTRPSPGEGKPRGSGRSAPPSSGASTPG